MDIVIRTEADPTTNMHFWFLCEDGCNRGHGWSPSIAQAAIDAENYLNTIKGNE